MFGLFTKKKEMNKGLPLLPLEEGILKSFLNPDKCEGMNSIVMRGTEIADQYSKIENMKFNVVSKDDPTKFYGEVEIGSIMIDTSKEIYIKWGQELGDAEKYFDLIDAHTGDPHDIFTEICTFFYVKNFVKAQLRRILC